MDTAQIIGKHVKRWKAYSAVGLVVAAAGAATTASAGTRARTRRATRAPPRRATRARTRRTTPGGTPPRRHHRPSGNRDPPARYRDRRRDCLHGPRPHSAGPRGGHRSPRPRTLARPRRATAAARHARARRRAPARPRPPRRPATTFGARRALRRRHHHQDGDRRALPADLSRGRPAAARGQRQARDPRRGMAEPSSETGGAISASRSKAGGSSDSRGAKSSTSRHTSRPPCGACSPRMTSPSRAGR